MLSSDSHFLNFIHLLINQNLYKGGRLAQLEFASLSGPGEVVGSTLKNTEVI